MKKAILFYVEGHNDTTLTNFRKEGIEILQKRGLLAKSAEYDFDHPPEVNLVLGSMVKFATAYSSGDNGKAMEENMEKQSIGFKAWLKPVLKEMGKSLWYGSKGPPMKEAKPEP